MSVDSKLFVVCKQEEKMSVVKKVLETLDTLSLECIKNKEQQSSCGRLQIVRNPITFGHYSIGAQLRSGDFESFKIDFGVGDENGRMVWVHTTCDCDISSYLPEDMGAVIVSVGCWGSNVMIMDTITNTLKSFGDVYIDYNDCDDVGYAKAD